MEQSVKTLKLTSKKHATKILGNLILNVNALNLHNMLYIIDLCTYLLSIGHITDVGNTLLFKIKRYIKS